MKCPLKVGEVRSDEFMSSDEGRGSTHLRMRLTGSILISVFYSVTEHINRSTDGVFEV